jgi:regulator of replication initiation timing
MFISNFEKEEIKTSIKILNTQVAGLLEELSQLRASLATKPKKEANDAKEEAAKLRRREYAKMYARKKKEEKLKAKFEQIIATAPTVTATA